MRAEIILEMWIRYNYNCGTERERGTRSTKNGEMVFEHLLLCLSAECSDHGEQST
jgi:hypothetical protein